MNETDLRVLRTRRLLKEAFVELVIAKGYDNTTIRDVTDHAQIGYRTFFRHYEDLKTLLHAVLEDIVAEMQSTMTPSRNPDVLEANLRAWFRIVQRHADLYRVLFRAPNYQELLEPIIAFSGESSKGTFKGVPIPDEIVVTHTVSATLSLIRWWVENDMCISPEDMADYTSLLVIRPVMDLIPSS